MPGPEQQRRIVVGRQTLTDFVWGVTTAPRPNTVEVYVGYLRRKLSRSKEVAIETVRRAGYLLAQPLTPPIRDRSHQQN